ncbi:helix-turn-helix domain-containing protein [Acaryochloris marina]|uniref:HTH cro/C1-type domain-containing protein n=1 Tax=Acaryochloris marina (strain MBIC 11017) TaxID=329726 RepID=A8ZK21_ACAM1|nr:helix-turn-helix transcriptional regulator [Acaryochloris marina]ABW31521.1 conserved hypothetical protein [Acaryochloris marina MBIC11017]
MLNRIKELLDNRPDPVSGTDKTTPYRFWQDTGVGRDTAYRMYNDPTYIPTSSALNKICEAYKIQPGDFLAWEPDSLSQDSAAQTESPEIPSSQAKKSDKQNQQKNSGRNSLLKILPTIPKTA